MRAADLAWWAAWASFVGFIVGAATFPLTGGMTCPAVMASAGVCGGYSLWGVVSALGFLVFLVGVPTAAGSWLYGRLAAPP